MSVEYEVEPLTKEERSWVRRLEQLLQDCPSDRLGLVTCGYRHLHVIDDKFSKEHDVDLEDGNAVRSGVALAEINCKLTVHGVSG